MLKAPVHTVEQLRLAFSYDPLTGVVSHTGANPRYLPGEPAGCVMKTGYLRISFGPRAYPAHHIAWALHHGVWSETILDHINQIKTDNRLSNLRQASYSLNNHNRVHKANRNGLAGVVKNGNRFECKIRDNTKLIYLGSFGSPEEAHEVYVAARSEIMSRHERSGAEAAA